MMDLAILADATDMNDEDSIEVPRTQATTTPSGPVFPPGRYGRRREPRRHRRGLAALALVAVLAATAALSVALFLRYGDPAYQARVVGYTELSEREMEIRFRVRLPAGEGAVCAVRARGRDGAEVGRAEVPVPAGATEVTYRLVTTGRPFVGEVSRCRPR
jgi:hypothetical protein